MLVGPKTTLRFVDFDSNGQSINLDLNNPFGQEVKVYVFELTVSDEYLKGYPAQLVSQSSTDIVVVSVFSELNEIPEAPSGFNMIVSGDGLSVSQISDIDDGNDYNAFEYLWFVPHDGSYETDTATLSF